MRAVVHLFVAFSVFALIPRRAARRATGEAATRVLSSAVLALLIPAMAYLLLSWVQLITRTLQKSEETRAAGDHRLHQL